MDDLPRLYFRLRENGAAVFLVDDGAENQRLDLKQIAVVNVRTGEIRLHGEPELSDQDRADISAWVDARRSELAAQARVRGRQCVEALNQTAQWAQSKATPEDLEAISDDLILAMHDLRSVLVRKKASRLSTRSIDDNPETD